MCGETDCCLATTCLGSKIKKNFFQASLSCFLTVVTLCYKKLVVIYRCNKRTHDGHYQAWRWVYQAWRWERRSRTNNPTDFTPCKKYASWVRRQTWTPQVVHFGDSGIFFHMMCNNPCDRNLPPIHLSVIFPSRCSLQHSCVCWATRASKHYGSRTLRC